MTLISIYVQNGINFYKEGDVKGAELCLVKAYELAKQYGFSSIEERDAFVELLSLVTKQPVYA